MTSSGECEAVNRACTSKILRRQSRDSSSSLEASRSTPRISASGKLKQFLPLPRRFAVSPGCQLEVAKTYLQDPAGATRIAQIDFLQFRSGRFVFSTRYLHTL